MKSKKCFKCGKIKSLDEFYKHPEMKDGYLGKCKECTKKDVHVHKDKNPEKIKAYDKKRNGLPHRVKARRKYAQSSQGKKAGSKAKRKWIEKNPLKRLANQMVYSAIRAGRLEKQPCERCGSTTKIHGHHDDYYKPLEVRWLCSACHIELHREMKEKTQNNIPF